MKKLTHPEWSLEEPLVRTFELGEPVFLLGHPEVEMVVLSVGSPSVFCGWTDGLAARSEWFPETAVAKYSHAGLVVHSGGRKVCLN
jgi:hypothetical protein